MESKSAHPHVAIACGGTGGHLFPGLAVGETLARRGARVTLLISRKEIDQLAVPSPSELRVLRLPAVGWSRSRPLAFLRGFLQSLRQISAEFRPHPPHAVLGMGGFTSAAPIWVGRRRGARLFLHEANAIPGRANRWFASRVDHAFVHFPDAARRLPRVASVWVGMPVRAAFGQTGPAECRRRLGLDPERPVLLIMGGSQGASALNELALRALPLLLGQCPELQCIHLTGSRDFPAVERAYAALRCRSLTRAFSSDMPLVVGAADVALSRAGASSLAEFAAVRVPAILIPYPSAADNHQHFNALALVEQGAARMMAQDQATPAQLAEWTLECLRHRPGREAMIQALARWHRPHAADEIAARILDTIGHAASPAAGRSESRPAASGSDGTAVLLRPAGGEERSANPCGVWSRQ